LTQQGIKKEIECYAMGMFNMGGDGTNRGKTQTCQLIPTKGNQIKKNEKKGGAHPPRKKNPGHLRCMGSLLGFKKGPKTQHGVREKRENAGG